VTVEADIAARPAAGALLALPPVAQLGYVVADLQSALAAFRPLFGDFVVGRFENEGYDFRGRLCDCVVDVAFAMCGELEIELIQPISGRGPHQEFLDLGRSGLHHLQHRAHDIEPHVRRLAAEGFDCIWRKRIAGFAIAYMVRADVPHVVELIEPLARAPRS
jgi:hypothetical protein